jgi:hypothetical protein
MNNTIIAASTPDTGAPAALLTPEEQAFVEAFEESTLPPGCFRHRDHVRLAWLYLRSYPVPAALARYGAGLKRLAAAHGKDGLYHETVTYAFLFLINERLQRQGRAASWDAFAARNADLLAGGLAFLNAYYRPETLASDVARAVFVMPDRLAPAGTECA